ncbi:uncharacterized protein LOC133477818 isoform X2 [Phyllopteryx taeniolatus]|uniref:uncharacterized protein LOC133477818 isoform X2 n=1 Tax=Phyllopteryx taeniolatus TaxID=161469 RepID=UPI002AD3604A|nr:uncharacterized protein LOC133477818 isoform X2 [Phyllopteryx taeniolatus]
MSQIILFIKVITLCYATRSEAKVEANCDQNVDLHCPCYDGTDFLLLTWYKMSDQGRRFVISIGEGYVEKENLSQRATFGKDKRLHLPAVRPHDSGTYKCVITANVGGRNTICTVDLLVHACVTGTPPNVLHSTVPSTVNTSRHEEELPVMWSVLGYLAVALTKVLASCTSIWVIQALCATPSRQANKTGDDL